MSGSAGVGRAVAVLVLVSVAAAHAPARAAEPARFRVPGIEDSYRWLFRGEVGLFAPNGLVGVTLGHQHLPFLRTELGLGLGVNSPVRNLLTLVSAMSIVSVGGRQHRFSVGAGLSGVVATAGGGRDAGGLLVNVDVAGYEYNGEGGYFFRVALGFAAEVATQDRPVLPMVVTPCGRVGVGLRF